LALGALMIFCVGSASAQDRVLFLSGKEFAGKVIEVDSMDVRFEKKKKKKTKEVLFAKDRIFAIQYGDGTTEIIYEPDSFEEDPFSIREMQFFVSGQHDAMVNFKSPFALYSSIVVGAGSVYFHPYGLILIAGYSIILGSLNVKVKEGWVSNTNLLREETYILGYRTKAKNKKIQNVIKGGLGGYLTTFILLLAL